MFKRLRRHLTPSLLIAIAAVVLATAGTSVAQRALIDSGDVRNNSLTGRDVRNKSLTRADFRGSVAGPRGPAGLPGAAGPQGPAGVANVTQVAGPIVPTCEGGSSGCQVQSSAADCPPGSRLVGGGYETGGVRDFVPDDKPSGNGWFVIAVNTNEFSSSSIQAFALCASGPGLAARTARNPAAERRGALARVRAQVG